ncbi:unnamed protein product [marine sediment metagenome]|uniref:Uncharacterized protein n=1 Tax=marine sediment metagenome TaxID=412755 RepID=X1TVK9_9ZZZZ
MGLKEITRVRQYTDFDADGRVQMMYEVTFTTEKTEGTFTLNIKRDEYTAEKAKELASAQAEEIDKAVG